MYSHGQLTHHEHPERIRIISMIREAEEGEEFTAFGQTY
jgi:hypothetical protein